MDTVKLTQRSQEALREAQAQAIGLFAATTVRSMVSYLLVALVEQDNGLCGNLLVRMGVDPLDLTRTSKGTNIR